MLIKAAVVNGVNEDYQFEQVRLDEPRADEVIVKIVASGICRSDEAARTGKAPQVFPAVLGHEGAGIVEKVGSAVKDLEVGDQVVLGFNYCGNCDSCRTGHPTICEKWPKLNMTGVRDDGSHTIFKEDGSPVANIFTQSSFATHALVNVNNVTKVDSDIDLRLVGPLGCGFATGSGTVINGLQLKANSSIAVFGTGAVGLGALMAAVIEGCTTVIAIDIHDERLELALELGATHTINSKTEDLNERIREITGDKGVDYSVDTTGVPPVMKSSIDVLAVRGVAAPIAVTPHNLEINTSQDLVPVSRKIIGVLMGDSYPQITIRQLIDYYKEGRFPFDKLIKFYRFEDIQRAAEDSNTGKTIKPVIIIDEDYRKDEPVEFN